MLYPIQNEYRLKMSLNGMWDFRLGDEHNPQQPLHTDTQVSVPASFNDQLAEETVRLYGGHVWYERMFAVPNYVKQERLVLRFGAVTHEAWVYVNGELIGTHQGGFLPFEFEMNDFLIAGDNRLTVKVSNLLTKATLPVGTTQLEEFAEGDFRQKVSENFDFFNYAGIHRSVDLYTTANNYIEDIVLTPSIDFTSNQATIQVNTTVVGVYDSIKVTIKDEAGEVVSTIETSEQQQELVIVAPHLWQPLAAYLYTVDVALLSKGTIIDSYQEKMGIREAKVVGNQFLINQKPFYFTGFGKHEDTAINGRGYNEVMNVLDIQLMKKMGANSLRTSHYPYSEEMMQLCDREGIVVIDETPAVGLMENFSTDVSSLDDAKANRTWQVMETQEHHANVLRELVARDKNYACVVMWSIANEAATYQWGAYEYFEPLFTLTRTLDTQKRPCTQANIISYDPVNNDPCIPLSDVICINRYYGWYIDCGDLEKSRRKLTNELAQWEEQYPDKPIMMTEYGAETIAGFHSNVNEPFSEEYQTAYYALYSEVFDQFENFIGEQVWNFADFQTRYDTNRVMGNRKGLFTRNRDPKQAVGYLAERWKKINQIM